MKTEFERISEIMYTLLKHQPVIDVPYEKINDIAVALVKEGYGKVSEYETEREMLGSQIKVLKTRLTNKYVEVEQLQKQLKQVQVEAQCKILCKLKERLQKYIWQKNIPEVMFNQEIETLIFELINERDFNLRNTLKGE